MAAEGATSIIAASIPALRAFFVERVRSPECRWRWLMASLVFGAKANTITPHKSSEAMGSSNSEFRQHQGDSGKNMSLVRCDNWDDTESSHELRPLSPKPVYRQAPNDGDIEWMAGRV